MLREHIPTLNARSITPLGAGWDNIAFNVDDAYVARFPRRAIAAPLLEREIALLPLIAPHVSLPISVPQYSGAPDEDYPWHFAVCRMFAGRTLDSVRPSHDALCALAAPLGTFVRELHDIDATPLIARGLPRDEIARIDHDKRFPLSRGRFASLEAAGIIDDASVFLNELLRLAPHTRESPALVIVHGDLYARHIMIDDGSITGIIDWGDLHFGDPAVDLGIVELVLPLESHAAFFAAYGPVDAATRQRARYRAIYHAALFAEYGLRTDDADARDAGRSALERIRRTIVSDENR
jgi:aminoglycoside phosphotransferase (APT) family kinase protein